MKLIKILGITIISIWLLIAFFGQNKTIEADSASGFGVFGITAVAFIMVFIMIFFYKPKKK